MKTTDEQQPLWEIEKLREKLRERIGHEDIEPSWLLEGVQNPIIFLQMEPKAFQRVWVEPLMEAGATMEEAIAGVTASYFLPN